MADSKITLDEVRKVAALARLELDEAELSDAQKSLDAILAYMDELTELDVTGVPPTSHAVPMAAPFRDDDVARCTPRDETLQQAPEAEAGAFSVPRVLEVDG